jgi:hypothetical protein
MTVLGSQTAREAGGDDSLPVPRPPGPDATEPSSLWVVPLTDPLVEALGFDPRSWYVEHFWLPVIGPTCTWLLRHVAAGLEAAAVEAAAVEAAAVEAAAVEAAAVEAAAVEAVAVGDDGSMGVVGSEPAFAAGFTLEVEHTALALGVGGRRGRHSPFGRALSRCVAFDLARFQGRDTLAVRRMLPPLARRHLLRLPPALQDQHQRWTAARHQEPTLDQQRRRARRLALGLVALGDGFDGAEAQLLRWGVHPALTDETVRWARALREA